MKIAAPFVTVLVAAGLPPAARAATVAVNFCGRITPSLTDADPDKGDDYLISNDTIAARGAWISVKNTVFGTYAYNGYTPDTGGDIGCTGNVYLDDTQTYRVSMNSKADVNGNELFVWDDHTSPSIYTYVKYFAWSPSAGTVYITPPSADQWNILAAASYAMMRSNGGVSGQDFDFATMGCKYEPGYGCEYGTPAGNCECGGKLYIGDADLKYVIVHEMGHAVSEAANGWANNDKNYDADYGACYTAGNGGHGMNQKEWQSAAVVEGLGHYYAAQAFNNTSGADCVFVQYKTTDWDLVGGAVNPGEQEGDPINCDGSPYSGIGAGDYVYQMCSPFLSNRGTEYDWLRFFWDLRTDGAVSTGDIFDIWAAAGPDAWKESGAGSDSTCATSDYPATRLRCAAEDLGFGSEWDDYDDYNGVHR